MKPQQTSASTVFGKSAGRGRVYRHGLEIAQAGNPDPMLNHISRWACGAAIDVDPVDFNAWLGLQLDSVDRCAAATSVEALSIVMLAASAPKIRPLCDARNWKILLARLVELASQGLAFENLDPTIGTLLAIELPLTLRWRFKRTSLPTAAAIATHARKYLTAEDFESSLLSSAPTTRLLLASVLRSMRLLKNQGVKPNQKIHAVAESLTAWVIAATDRNGHDGFGGHDAFNIATSANRSPPPIAEFDSIDLDDDLKSGGLLDIAADLDRQTFAPAVAAVLGRSKSRGRLAWQVSLPESMLLDEVAGKACLMPEWDVRRGKTLLDFANGKCHLTIYSGRRAAIDGALETSVSIDGKICTPQSDWELTCSYTDDDVHYFEIEQTLTGDVALQRQFLLIREDRALMMADTVLPPVVNLPTNVEHQLQLSLGREHVAAPEPDTREMFLSAGGRRTAMIVPLASNEWRIGPNQSTLERLDTEFSTGSDSRTMVWRTKANGRLYTPLWFDFQRRRFKRPRTWRRLTVAEDLSVCPDNVATAFRMQSGSSQWMFYRSLSGRAMRTVLGKHMVSDFFASRFDPGDGVHEELVTVDDD